MWPSFRGCFQSGSQYQSQETLWRKSNKNRFCGQMILESMHCISLSQRITNENCRTLFDLTWLSISQTHLIIEPCVSSNICYKCSMKHTFRNTEFCSMTLAGGKAIHRVRSPGRVVFFSDYTPGTERRGLGSCQGECPVFGLYQGGKLLASRGRPDKR